MKATARAVMTIRIDIEQLIAAVRRHVPLTPKAALAIRNDLGTFFSTTRVTLASSVPIPKSKASADRAVN